MDFYLNDNFKTQIKKDLSRKYLKSGKKIAGSISDEKIILFLEDDFGKHSAFMSHYFYGKIFENRITGKFRPANYVIVLLSILFLISVESITAAIILGGYTSVIMPVLIMIGELFYFYYLKRISSENDELIRNYLSVL